ncbi:EAL domain-containing protein [Pelagerythrobacter sp.]|uniref:EAL domain-containing protein n=1 Tax=Pelagerythrobacter sp. TaxID=2800702 RepID=UPI0035B042AE
MTSINERRLSADRRTRQGGLARDLAAALDRGEIEVLFQPQFACADGTLAGAEALVRWNHPRRGQIGAEAMFAIASRAGTAEALTRHIGMRALADAGLWPADLRLSINVTATDLAADDFAESMIAMIEAAGFPPGRLTLEITEQALVSDVERSAAQLALLAARGIRLALDDFGAGFCNFRYLKILPLDYLKLDRTMVEGIVSDARDLAVLRAIVAMASALDLAVIAEGIESEDQLASVRKEGCAVFQGFLRAKPMTADAFAALARGDS